MERQLVERLQLVGELVERQLMERIQLVERRMARSELGLMRNSGNRWLGASWG